ncbi:Hint domain-containing protein [Paracoccus sp. p3-h83]|uniref:Hint domain-containing protein n=1 Tax=Paracoccus sp. p3-h83 TaxID=3342805 RepID=UPI0035BB9652
MATEDFNWVGAGGVTATGQTLSTNVPSSGLSYTQNTGNYTVTTKIVDTAGGTDMTTLATDNNPYQPENYGGYFNAGQGFSTTSALKMSSASGTGSVGTLETSFDGKTGFTDTVENVKFAISNLDRGLFRDSVRITAYNGTQAVPVTLTILDGGRSTITNGVTLSNGSATATTQGQSLTGTSVTATANNISNNIATNNNDHQILVSIAGPITGFKVEFIRDSSTSGNTGTSYIYMSDIVFGTVAEPAPCFARGTMILTDRGPVAIEDLVEGDMVMTRDNGAQPIRWIGTSSINLTRRPHLAPIRIRAGALGAGQPTADLLVSPQHRILVQSAIAQRLFGAPEVLVAAKQLLQVDGIDIATDLAEVDYFHMLFDAHEVVTSNGAASESLFTGPEALKAVGAAARAEILAIFPELARRDYQPVGARILASGRMGRKLAVRHAQNGKPLVQ